MPLQASLTGGNRNDVIVSEGSGDEVLRGEDVVAHHRCQPL
jgi:hypothetical protein